MESEEKRGTCETRGTCRKCRSTISTEAIRCPQCGYEPSSKWRTTRKVTALVGVLLTFTIFGAVVGVPLLVAVYVVNWYMRRKLPTNSSPYSAVLKFT